MENFYYDRVEKLKPDPNTRQIGTEYYHGLNKELLDSVQFAKKWIPLLDQLFEELDETWFIHPNKLVRRRGATARTPKETLQELLDIVNRAEQPLKKGNKWKLPVHAWDKFNRVMEEGFTRIGHSDCWDDPDYGLNIEWKQGIRPMKQTKQKNQFFNLASFQGGIQ